jgi:hypothetical protein
MLLFPTGTVVQLISIWQRSVHSAFSITDALVVAAHMQVQQVVPNRQLARCAQHIIITVCPTNMFSTN